MPINNCSHNINHVTNTATLQTVKCCLCGKIQWSITKEYAAFLQAAKAKEAT